MRGRFAPTPSGKLHIGNAGTALLSWLQVRNAGGTFILRIEDLDQFRIHPEAADQLTQDLQWLGIDWDEGPNVGGPYHPYKQSERQTLYQEALNRLLKADRLYPCFCSRKKLRNACNAAGQKLPSTGPIYPGYCRHLSPQERAEKASKKQPSLRFAITDQTLLFYDLVMGSQFYSSPIGGDFIVKRADDVFSYQLAVVVDDAAMGISDVLRGADLLDATPWQILLYQALDYPAPQFTHVPLLYGSDGNPFSKRYNPDETLASFRARGVNPETVVGQLAFLYGLIDKPEPIKARELIPLFDVWKIPKDPIYIPEKFSI